MAKKPESIDPTKPRPALAIKSRPASFWRCARQFHAAEERIVPLDELTEAEIQTLEAESQLVVVRTEIAPA